MVGDVLALLGHLEWPSAHVIGHSMGSMIATRLAVVTPDMVDSLTLIATCRRFVDLWPRSFKSVSLFLNMFLSPLDAEGRALLDLKCHFTQDYLEEEVPAGEVRGGGELSSHSVSVDVLGADDERTSAPALTRRESLKQEYMRKASIKHNHQPDHGFKGQMNAVSPTRFGERLRLRLLTGSPLSLFKRFVSLHLFDFAQCRCHFVSREEIDTLRKTTFPFLMIHGTEDFIIPWQAGQKFFLMLKNRSKFMLLHGAHFLSRERAGEVVNAILQQIFEGWIKKTEETRIAQGAK